MGNIKNKVSRILKSDKDLKDLLTGSGLSLILKVVGMFATYGFILFVSRVYGAGVMGFVSLSLTVFLLLTTIAKLGLDTTLLRYISEYAAKGEQDLIDELYAKVLLIIVPFTLTLSSVFFFAAPYLATNIFHKEALIVYFQIIALGILPSALIFINSESLRGVKKIIAYSFLQNIGVALFTLILLLISWFFTRNIYLPVVLYVGAAVFVCFLSLLLWFRAGKIRFSDIIKNRHLLNKISFNHIYNVSQPIFFSGLFLIVIGWADTIILGMFRPESEVGIYGIALRLANLVGLTLLATNAFIAPRFAEFYSRQDMEGLKKIVKQSTKLIFLASLPTILVLLLFPGFLLGIFGNEFKAGTYVLMILTLGYFFNSISGSVGYLLNMTNNQQVVQKILFFSMVVSIILNFLLIQYFGMIGAAVANMITIILWNALMVKYIYDKFGFLIIYIPFIKQK